jgi:hypothetical protein
MADRGGEEKRMKWAVTSSAGGGGSASAAVRGRGAERWLHLSSLTPSPAGRGGEER